MVRPRLLELEGRNERRCGLALVARGRRRHPCQLHIGLVARCCRHQLVRSFLPGRGVGRCCRQVATVRPRGSPLAGLKEAFEGGVADRATTYSQGRRADEPARASASCSNPAACRVATSPVHSSAGAVRHGQVAAQGQSRGGQRGASMKGAASPCSCRGTSLPVRRLSRPWRGAAGPPSGSPRRRSRECSCCSCLHRSSAAS